VKESPEGFCVSSIAVGTLTDFLVIPVGTKLWLQRGVAGLNDQLSIMLGNDFPDDFLVDFFGDREKSR
jgi:hypothetical protein